MPLILFISFILAAGVYIVQPLADPDLWWHIVAGRWIMANQQLPVKDIWTMFGADVHWIAYSWSNEIVFALFDHLFGLKGLLFLQISLAVCFAASLCWTLGKVSNNFVLGSLLGASIVVGCHAHFTLRPQSVVWLFFAATLFLCERISQRGLTRSNLIGLMLIFCVWANTHITTIIGLGVILAWLCPNFPWYRGSMRPMLIAALLSLFATFLTPYLGYEWIVFFTKSGHPLMFTSIQEFAPATILQSGTSFLILLMALSAAFWNLNRQALTFFQIAGASVLILGSLIVIKFLPFALIYMGFLLARQWRETDSVISADSPGLIEALRKLEIMVRAIPKEGLSFVLVSTAIVNIVNTYEVLINRNEVAVEAVDFIRNQDLPLPIMNNFTNGGYLIYRFADAAGNPGAKVSIDGRTNLISHKLWEIYQNSWSGNWNWRAYLDLVMPKTILWRGDSSLIRILEAEGKWCTIFNKGSSPTTHVVMIEQQTLNQLNASGKKLNCLQEGGGQIKP